MAVCHYKSRFTVTANTLLVDGTVDATPGTPTYVAAGTYYLDSATSAESFRVALDNALEAAFGAENFTVTFDLDTGKFAIQCTSLAGTWAIAFNQALADLLGWGATLGFPLQAGGTATAPEIAQYQIFADSGRSNWKGYASDVAGADGRSGSGVSSGVGSPDVLYDGMWTHAHEPELLIASPLASGTRDDAGTQRPWTWMDFMDHHRATRQPFRYYDGTGLTLLQYEKVLKLAGKSTKKFTPDTQEPGSRRYWIVDLEVEEWRAAT